MNARRIDSFRNRDAFIKVSLLLLIGKPESPSSIYTHSRLKSIERIVDRKTAPWQPVANLVATGVSVHQSCHCKHLHPYRTQCPGLCRGTRLDSYGCNCV